MNQPAAHPWLSHWTGAFFAVILALAITFGASASAWSSGLERLSTVPPQQVVEDDVFLSGDVPVLQGRVNGDVFAVGRAVYIEGDVEGSVFILAERAYVQGAVGGSVYSAALAFKQEAASVINHSLYVAALNVATERDARIERDLHAVAVSANLRGSVGRETDAVIGLIELFRVLRPRVTGGITALPIRQAAAPALGVGRIIAFAPNVMPDGGFRSQPGVQTDETEEAAAEPWWRSSLESLVVLFILGGLALWLFPTVFRRTVAGARRRPLAATGVGAIVLINGFLIPVLVAALVGGIFFGLLYLSLPSLAWIVLGLGLGLVITFFSLFLFAFMYISKAVVAVLVGEWIIRLLLPRLARRQVLALLIGLILYVALASVPYLGFTIAILVSLLGLGAMWLTWRSAALSSTVVLQDSQPDATPVVEPAA